MTYNVKGDTMDGKFQELLEAFNKLPKAIKPRPTLLEISGQPHFENVISNILKFYFDPNELHNLGTLVLDALLDDDTELQNIQVEREVKTNKGNRIDIVITGSVVIGIENKIYASVYNDLSDYSEYLDRLAVPNKKIVLSLYPVSEQAISGAGFYNVIYTDFIQRIRTRLELKAHLAETRYFIGLVDLLETIENLNRGVTMSSSTIEFFVKNETTVGHLLDQAEFYIKYLREQIPKLAMCLGDWQPKNCKSRSEYKESNRFFCTQFFDLQTNDFGVLGYDITRTLHGWQIVIITREKSYAPKLKKYLQNQSIEILEEQADRFVIWNLTDKNRVNDFVFIAKQAQDIATKFEEL